MKLSEAIREGAKLGPQIKAAYESAGGYCALGGALTSYWRSRSSE